MSVTEYGSPCGEGWAKACAEACGKMDGAGRMAKTAELLKVLKEKNVAMGPAAVERARIERSAETARGSGIYSYAQAGSRTDAALRVPLAGTAEIARRYFPDGLPGRGTLDAGGNLCLVMKKVEGVWFWQPFGW